MNKKSAYVLLFIFFFVNKWKQTYCPINSPVSYPRLQIWPCIDFNDVDFRSIDICHSTFLITDCLTWSSFVLFVSRLGINGIAKLPFLCSSSASFRSSSISLCKVCEFQFSFKYRTSDLVTYGNSASLTNEIDVVVPSMSNRSMVGAILIRNSGKFWRSSTSGGLSYLRGLYLKNERIKINIKS